MVSSRNLVFLVKFTCSQWAMKSKGVNNKQLRKSEKKKKWKFVWKRKAIEWVWVINVFSDYKKLKAEKKKLNDKSKSNSVKKRKLKLKK